MKDVPHHMKKLNKKVLRSENGKEVEQEEGLLQASLRKEDSEKQKKKKEKIERRKQAFEKAPPLLSEEDKNEKMKHRTPIKKERSHKTKIG